MRKIKLFIASFIGAIALVFACVFSSVNVNATTNSSYVFDTSEIEVDTTAFGSATKDGVQLGESIFYAVDTASSPKFSYQKSATLKDRTYLSGLYLADSSKDSRNIRIVAPSSGRLKVMAYNPSKGRTISLKDSDYKDLSPVQSYDTVKEALQNDYIYFDINSAGTYRLGSNGSIGFYYLEFIPFQVFQQEASDSTYSYVRFISIVESETALTASNFNLSIKMTYNDTLAASYGESYTRICTPRVVTKITNGKDANDIPVDYVATINGSSYTFNGHTNTYYVVFVIKLTTATFTGSKIQSTLTYNGQSLTASESTI